MEYYKKAEKLGKRDCERGNVGKSGCTQDFFRTLQLFTPEKISGLYALYGPAAGIKLSGQRYKLENSAQPEADYARICDPHEYRAQ